MPTLQHLFLYGTPEVSGAAEQSTPTGRGSSSSPICSKLQDFACLRPKPPKPVAESSEASAPPRRMLIDLMHEEMPTGFTDRYSKVLRLKKAQAQPSPVRVWEQGQSSSQGTGSADVPHQAGETVGGSWSLRQHLSAVDHGVRPPPSSEIEIVEVSDMSTHEITPVQQPSSSATGKRKIRFSHEVEVLTTSPDEAKKEPINNEVKKPGLYQRRGRIVWTDEEAEARKFHRSQIKLAGEQLEELALAKPWGFNRKIAKGHIPSKALKGIEGLQESDHIEIINKFQTRQQKVAAALMFLKMVENSPPGTFTESIRNNKLPDSLHAKFKNEIPGLDPYIIGLYYSIRQAACRLVEMVKGSAAGTVNEFILAGKLPDSLHAEFRNDLKGLDSHILKLYRSEMAKPAMEREDVMSDEETDIDEDPMSDEETDIDEDPMSDEETAMDEDAMSNTSDTMHRR